MLTPPHVVTNKLVINISYSYMNVNDYITCKITNKDIF